MNLSHIRNFSIIAHIDHGKSTLADRMLELTHTIEKRKMMNQVLDNMELEREKGITIKMRPVKMHYKNAKVSANGETNANGDDEIYELNLIDTPGHIDFSYEVSRALKAVEGCILLVDATQGVQAQTLTTLNIAKEAGLTIIPVLSKVDSPLARLDEIKEEMVMLLGCDFDDIMETSGKTGQGVEKLLQQIIKKVPAPVEEIPNSGSFRGLVFDFQYSNHKGVIVCVRVLEGSVKKGDELVFKIAGEKFYALEVGMFTPEEVPVDKLTAGQTGYIVTGIKQPGIASVGDTITLFRKQLPELPGYMSPSPVVWASVYPEDADDFEALKQALGKLRLSDSAFTHEEESSGSLGRGFRCGFLGLLHLEIITERLKREFNLNLVIATPSITYEVTLKRNGNGQTGDMSGRGGNTIDVGTANGILPANGIGNVYMGRITTHEDGRRTVMIYSPSMFPDHGVVERVQEPWVKLSIITPDTYTGDIYQLLYDHEAELSDTISFGDGRAKLVIHMPLRELMRNFFDELKSISSGYASLSYEFEGMRDADVTRLDILVADEPVEAFTRVVSQRRVEEEAKKAVEKLKNILPRQLFVAKIQGRANGRIIASETLSALRKDVTGYLYGGDITRKMKLLEKQKKGKKKMAERGKGNVNIPHDVFLKMMKSGE
jgi:GTP-binding protein LepA